MDTIINKVAESSLLTIDIADFLKDQIFEEFDIKPFLFKELILKEADFRLALKAVNWKEYEGKNIAVFCSTDAIIPIWAFMLITSYLTPFAKTIFFGDIDKSKELFLLQTIKNMDSKEYENKRIVIKGCGSVKIPDSAYIAITSKLILVCKSIFYGEPCSTVPIFKKK
ncbi:MAG: DUF2480 family protein [Sediminibacterium sp.]|nr:DUF2480 family protein [Sediminibacterium sp.]